MNQRPWRRLNFKIIAKARKMDPQTEDYRGGGEEAIVVEEPFLELQCNKRKPIFYLKYQENTISEH